MTVHEQRAHVRVWTDSLTWPIHSGKHRFCKGRKMTYRKLSTLTSLAVTLGLGASVFPARGAEPFLVKDINPGADSSSPIELTAVNGVLLFSADDGTHRTELWISDATMAGTALLRDICSRHRCQLLRHRW